MSANFLKNFATFAIEKQTWRTLRKTWQTWRLIKITMAKILTGVQSTGTPHLGNLLGAIIPAIALSNKPENESFLFIADLHSITQIKNGKLEVKT